MVVLRQKLHLEIGITEITKLKNCRIYKITKSMPTIFKRLEILTKIFRDFFMFSYGFPSPSKAELDYQ